MTQTAIPYILMRGGTSRGPYFRREDLPQDQDKLAEVLVALIGSGHALNIDGIGGGAAVTTKVAMLSASDDDWAHIDYFFAQVSVENRLVDFKPTCGNILAGVGPAAIEMGLITPQDSTTTINIRALNTNARVKATLATPGGALTYAGDTAIAGVPGTAAPVGLDFLDVVGSSTGALLPSGKRREVINGIEVTCMDVAMPLVIARAEAFGLGGHETAEELDKNRDFFARMEAVRIEAGARMGIDNVAQSVTPKFGLLSTARSGGTIAARYFMPWKTHPSMAVTGAQCLASCVLMPGTIADGLLERPTASPATISPATISPATISIEHPGGLIEVVVNFRQQQEFVFESAGLVRTARKLADGHVYIPGQVWR